MSKPTRRVALTHGIAGTRLERVEREVPAGEPPPLPPNAELRAIGKRIPRLDARAKVTGAALYTGDIRLPGMLWARMVTAPHPHARITAVDTSAAERMPGVRAVHVIENPPGSGERWPLVRYGGQPVAAVAATSQKIAEDAARLVKVAYEVLPFVVDEDLARRESAPTVYASPPSGRLPLKGNVLGPALHERGDVVLAIADAPFVVEGEFRTQVQTHSPTETHGAVADWRPDGLTVYLSTQATVVCRDEIARLFDIPQSRVRVVTEYMGGGFGSKLGLRQAETVPIHLSRKAGAPVRLMLDRREEQLSAGNRPSSHVRLRIAAGADGKLQAIVGQSWGTAGVATGTDALMPARAMYETANLKVESFDVFTNAGPGCAMRAPGHPQGVFALEQTMDMLAEKLGIDPLALRDLNDPHAARREERRIGAEKFGWSRRGRPGASKGAIKRGMGMAQSVWYRFVEPSSAVEVRILGDGSVEVKSAVQDIGTGTRTALAQVVAEELGIGVADVRVHIGDTEFPVGPTSGGSMTISSITPPARNAAHDAKARMTERLAAALAVDVTAIEWDAGTIRVRGERPREMTFREAAKQMRVREVAARAERTPDYVQQPVPAQIGGVQFAEVSVDTETGGVHVERILAVHDCGRPINPLAVENQIQGGIIQGISYALHENRIIDAGAGAMVNPNLETYKISGSRDIPPIEVILLEEYNAISSTDALGIGEPATIPTAGAIANAIYNAIGVRITELPITPARILAALGRTGEGRTA